MDTIDDQKLESLLSRGDAEPITPEHRAWMNAEIEKTLAKMDAGETTYHSLDDVMREFGFDAP
jgi:hypothetical protein